ncbi:MAG: efflux RND transporter periplasmic adaptor subunit [Thermovirga sp.]
MTKMKKNILIILAVALAATVGVWFYVSRAADKPVVQTTAIERGGIVKTVSATGSLAAVNTVSIGAQVSGTIKKIHVDYNSVVTKGQMLAEIDPALMQASLKQSESSVLSAKASLAEARADLVEAKRTLDRNTELFAKDYIAESERDESQTAWETAAARVQSAKASLAEAEADLEYKKINLDYTKIFSPIDGVVIDREVDEGQTVNASQTAPELFTIAENLARMQVEADIDEADIGLIRKGQVAEFTVDAYPEELFEGVVSEVRLAAATTDNVVTYTVIIGVNNDKKNLMPGMTANVSVIVEKKEDILKVSSAALRFRPSQAVQTQGSVLWTFDDGSLRSHSVKTGIYDGLYTEVEGESIKEGMHVVTDMTVSDSAEVGQAFGLGGAHR